MQPAAAFLVDFQSADDIARKRQALQGCSESLLRAVLTRNHLELINETDSLRCRRILSGSILIRCELTRRRTGAALGDPTVAGERPDGSVVRFA